MLVGQDPTIYLGPSRVMRVLMLDDDNGQLSRWLRSFLGEAYESATIYGINVIKCTFDQPPSQAKTNLRPYFSHCRDHLLREIKLFKPTLLLSFGEPANQLFVGLCDTEGEQPHESMKISFTGDFYSVSVEGHLFKYSPCLHIKTFRIAETYGSAVEAFKASIRAVLQL